MTDDEINELADEVHALKERMAGEISLVTMEIQKLREMLEFALPGAISGAATKITEAIYSLVRK